MTAIAVTGHRPPGICGSWRNWERARPRVQRLAADWLAWLDERPTLLITGLAQGWDMVCAHAAMDLGIPVRAQLPHVGHGDQWPDAARRERDILLGLAAEVRLSTTGGYHPAAMQVRNMDVVNAGDRILALWNGGPGGTANALDYNRRLHDSARPVDNLWAEWLTISSSMGIVPA